jgi:hypothetical protein
LPARRETAKGRKVIRIESAKQRGERPSPERTIAETKGDRAETAAMAMRVRGNCICDRRRRAVLSDNPQSMRLQHNGKREIHANDLARDATPVEQNVPPETVSSGGIETADLIRE